MLKTIKKIGHLIYKDVRGSQRMRLRDSYDDLKLFEYDDIKVENRGFCPCFCLIWNI